MSLYPLTCWLPILRAYGPLETKLAKRNVAGNTVAKNASASTEKDARAVQWNILPKPVSAR